MSIFYVQQGETYNEESAGGYIWSPQLTRNGRRNIGYTTMTKVRKDDYIIHVQDGRIKAISIAKADYYESPRPAELPAALWGLEGYRVDTEYHFITTTPYDIWQIIYIYNRTSAIHTNF